MAVCSVPSAAMEMTSFISTGKSLTKPAALTKPQSGCNLNTLRPCSIGRRQLPFASRKHRYCLSTYQCLLQITNGFKGLAPPPPSPSMLCCK